MSLGLLTLKWFVRADVCLVLVKQTTSLVRRRGINVEERKLRSPNFSWLSRCPRLSRLCLYRSLPAQKATGLDSRQILGRAVSGLHFKAHLFKMIMLFYSWMCKGRRSSVPVQIRGTVFSSSSSSIIILIIGSHFASAWKRGVPHQ